MVTFAGTQKTFEDALKSVIEIDLEAVDAYETALKKLNKDSYKKHILEFKNDHLRHIQELTILLDEKDIQAPTKPNTITNWLTQGKIIIGDMLNDEAILKALLSNEKDTNKAYENINKHDLIWPNATTVLKDGWEDEKNHKKWLKDTIDNK